MRPESLYFLFSPVTRIKGVGGSLSEAFSRLLPTATTELGMTSLPIVRDLLFHLPVQLVDRRFTCALNAAPGDRIATFTVTVDTHLPPKQKRFGRQPYKVVCSNDTGTLTLVFFHARDDYIKTALPLGARRVVSGRTDTSGFELQMVHPDIITTPDKLADTLRSEPVYPLTAGLTSRRIGKIVEEALAKLPELPEWQAAPDIGWKAALVAAHHPQTEDDLLPTAPARLRLAYDEMLARQLHLALARLKTQRQKGIAITGREALKRQMLAALPFQLTAGQQAVLADIETDLASGQRMTRLLQGDVGSGKTVVALLAMLRAAGQGLQSALMAPTELIARQHFQVISSLLGRLEGAPRVVLLTGSVKGRAREEALSAIASGDAAMVVGTHALFQEQVQFAALALVVVDEQHRFGVGQRMALSGKGDNPHLLHMSATPIPRSLTMMLYGDMDCSLLKEKPAGRQPIATRLIPKTRYAEVLERLQAALARGEKAYWICPLVEASEQMEADIAAAESRFKEFSARFGPVVGLMHGRMKADERDRQMQRFAEGQTTLLVATTVVEVGVDVKDATIIVIEQAERFGLAQLHQLRGRVGRGEKPSACVLLYDEGAASGQRLAAGGEDPNRQSLTANRLSILRETEDGFKIAEADLAQRGGGELLGHRQSGLPRFIFTDLALHQPLMARARDEVAAQLAQDEALTSPRGAALRLLLQLFGYHEPGV